MRSCIGSVPGPLSCHTDLRNADNGFPPPSALHQAPLDLSEAQFVAKIMAGDPSRGAMSVETEEEVREGSYVVVSNRLAHATL